MTSLSEVARRSGVSETTASRALNPRRAHMVSEATRARVLAVSNELNFRPNALARGLRNRYSNTIGVIVHDIRDPYFAEGARAISDAAAEHGFLAMICSTERDPATEVRYVGMLVEHKVAGVIFMSGGLEDPEYRDELSRLRMSIQEYGGSVLALGPRWDPWPAEVADNKGGGFTATEYLLELGHRHIALVDGPPGLRTTVERRSGYIEALEHAGIPADASLIRPGGYTTMGGDRAVAELFDSGAEFTAVFASNDAMAVGCLHELKQRRLRVPRDISLVGFGDVPAVRWLDPPLTTVAMPIAAIGEAGVTRLLRQLYSTGRRRGGRRVNVHSTELVVRGTTGPPGKGVSNGHRTRRSARARTQADRVSKEST